MEGIAEAPIEDCDECGFRWELWDLDRGVAALLVTGALLRESLDGVDLELANTRPAPGVWSILEYVDHVRAAMWLWRFVVDAAVAEPGIDLRVDGPATTPIASPAPTFEDVEATIAAAEAEAAELFTALYGLEADQWTVTALVNPGLVDLRWVLRHALHEALHHLHDVGRARARQGDGVAAQTGTIVQLNVSGGGVPKTPVPEVEVTAAGVVGDHQDDRVHHGRPFQALCLYGTDVIEALQAEGHPIQAGSAGENVTIAGLDWSSLRPGAVLTLGDEVRAELSSYATPCAKNAQWFVERDYKRMDQDEHPGWSRLYATVLVPGTLRIGDAVVVEP